MKRQAQRLRERQQGRAISREIPVPLPLRGLMAESKSSEMLGMFATKFKNLKTDGTILEIIPSAQITETSVKARMRFPFEVTEDPHYVEAAPNDRVNGKTASAIRYLDKSATYTTLSGNLILVDGRGYPMRYDGTRFYHVEWTTDTGDSPVRFNGVVAHHERLFFWKYGGTPEFYYGEIGEVQGNLTRFPLSRLGNIKGELAAVMSITMDAGENLNDRLAIVTTTGQVIIYEGLNPGDASSWSQVARFQAAPPLGPWAFTQVGGDIWMATATGIVSVLQSMQQGIMALAGPLAKPIGSLVKTLAQEGGVWQLHASGLGDKIILNRMFEEQAQQFIFYTESQTWGQANYPARWWHNLGNRTEFTSIDGDLGYIDEVGTEPVIAEWHSSWFRLRKNSTINHLIPTFRMEGGAEVSVWVLSDHDELQVDLDEAEQTVTMEPDEPGDGLVTLDDIIATDAVGSSYQIRVRITASRGEIIALHAGVS